MIAKAPRSSNTVRNVTENGEVHARLAQKLGKISFKRKLDVGVVVCLLINKKKNTRYSFYP